MCKKIAYTKFSDGRPQCLQVFFSFCDRNPACSWTFDIYMIRPTVMQPSSRLLIFGI